MHHRLEKVLSKSEIDLIKAAIYSRLEIQIGKESFSPNVRITQSPISPALFNIYVENLYQVLEDTGVAMKHLMGYTDDRSFYATQRRTLEL